VGGFCFGKHLDVSHEVVHLSTKKLIEASHEPAHIPILRQPFLQVLWVSVDSNNSSDHKCNWGRNSAALNSVTQEVHQSENPVLEHFGSVP
jgi:hypothetical protein